MVDERDGTPSGEPSAGRIRLAKLMADRGLASRRGAEQMIREGRVSVNGHVVEGPGISVDPQYDAVKVDGRNLPAAPERVYWLVNKPRGCATGTPGEEGRKNLFDLLPDLGRGVAAVGSLEYDAEGALLITNDGDLAHLLTHPSTQVPSRWLVKCYRTPDERDLAALARGVTLEEGRTRPAKVRVVETTDKENAWVEIAVVESRNRLVRRMFERIGHPVSKIRRESVATLSVRGMDAGAARRLTPEEVRRLQDIAAGKKPSKAGRVKKRKGFAVAKPKKPRHSGKARASRAAKAAKTAKDARVSAAFDRKGKKRG